MARLIVKQRGLETRSFLLSDVRLTIGRAATNIIVIPNRYASGRHCEICCEDGRCVINDLNSTNGLFINGKKVTSKQLEDGDRILIGAATLLFIADEEAIRIDSLLTQLQKGASGEREIAANLLGQLGAKAAAEGLLRALKEDADGKVKAAAAEALGLLGETRAAKVLLSLFDTQEIHLRNSVVRAIIRVAGERNVADIAHYLQHPEKRVRVAAAYVLGQTHCAHAARVLQQALGDESFDVREAVVKALGDLGNQESVDMLLKVANEPQDYPLVWIIDSLGKIADPRALPAVMNALKNTNSEVREAAADAVGRLRAREAVPPLISLLDDPNMRVRASAAKSLEKLRRYLEMERKLASLQGDAHKTMEISLIGEAEPRATPGESTFGEDKDAWEKWWCGQAAASRNQDREQG